MEVVMQVTVMVVAAMEVIVMVDHQVHGVMEWDMDGIIQHQIILPLENSWEKVFLNILKSLKHMKDTHIWSHPSPPQLLGNVCISNGGIYLLRCCRTNLSYQICLNAFSKDTL